jgi:NAD(P)H-flavin reductase
MQRSPLAASNRYAVADAREVFEGQYLRVCKDGPVFEAGRIDWGRL